MLNSLSILIPCYNGLCIELVSSLQQQADCIAKDRETVFKYEIIVGDDGSTDCDVIEKNKEINFIPNCRYIIRGFNSGRAVIRNFLARTAKYEWLLFIDYGRTLRKQDFISTYIHIDNPTVVYGGYDICDCNEILKHNLRYLYEKKYNKNSIAAERMRNCYKSFNTCNFMVKRSIMLDHPFDERFRKYGYEDVVWGKTLYNNGIKISHIDNSLYTEDFDDNESFVTKTEESMKTLVDFYDELKGYSTVIETEEKLKKFHILTLFVFFFNATRKLIKNNLSGNKPHVFLFNIYKLGTFCLNKKNLLSKS